jgi:hypothetical protein
MWRVVNLTPFAAAATWTRDVSGAHLWVVACKAQYVIAKDGTLDLHPDQPEPLLAPEFHGEDGLSSVRFDADLGLPKPSTDVLVNGTAHAPNGKPATSVPVALRFAGVEKTLVVQGERVFRSGIAGLVPGPAAPFVTKPIRYELAYGGTAGMRADDPTKGRMDARNPIGRGFGAEVGDSVPCVEFPGGMNPSRGPAGFGALASHWAPRSALCGTYDAAWIEHRKPLLPKDYDDRFALSSPLDQRAKAPVGPGTRFDLVNMEPSGVLAFALPNVCPSFVTRFGNRRVEHRASLATVTIEPSSREVSLVWQGSLPVTRQDVEYLDETRIGVAG